MVFAPAGSLKTFQAACFCARRSCCARSDWPHGKAQNAGNRGKPRAQDALSAAQTGAKRCTDGGNRLEYGLNKTQHSLTMQKVPDIGECIEKNLAQYFRDLHGAEAGGVYDMVLMRVEKPMIAYVMAQCKGNQSKAAQVLGLNRNTLRKKLALHGFLDTPSS
jgi:putative fis-like DNA-binding protein